MRISDGKTYVGYGIDGNTISLPHQATHDGVAALAVAHLDGGRARDLWKKAIEEDLHIPEFWNKYKATAPDMFVKNDVSPDFERRVEAVRKVMSNHGIMLGVGPEVFVILFDAAGHR